MFADPLLAAFLAICTLVLFPQIDGFNEFPSRLKILNPQIVTKGL